MLFAEFNAQLSLPLLHTSSDMVTVASQLLSICRARSTIDAAASSDLFLFSNPEIVGA